MNEKSITDMTNAGVNTFVVGPAIFDEDTLKTDIIRNLQSRATKTFSKWKEDRRRKLDESP